MSYQKKNFSQDEPRCVICSFSFYFRDPTNPYGAKCPHILHCGHTACEGCLISALQKNNALVCPVCTTVSEAKKFSDPKNMKKSEILSLREEFPLNAYTVGQVSLKRNKTNTGEGLIKFCSKNKMTNTNTVNCNECNDRPADCSCRQCETELCSNCFASIHNSVTLRKHEKISLKEKKVNELFEENMCKNHKGLFLNIFCKDCEIYICKECIIDAKHLEHRCTDVFQRNEDKLPEFSELFDETNNVLKQLYATRKKLQQPGTRSQVHDEEALKVERQVQCHYSYLHGMLQRQEEELLKKIRSVGEAAQKSLEAVSVDVEKNIKEIENILALSNCTMNTSKIKEFPLESLMEKLRNLSGTPCHLVLNDEENSKFQFYVDPNITEALAGHCTVNVPAKRVYELLSNCELPESYQAESLKNIPDPFIKPDLKILRIGKEKDERIQKALLNAIVDPTPPPPRTDAKTKPQDFQRKSRAIQQQNSIPGNLSGSLLSVSSRESAVDQICKVEALTQGSSDLVRMVHLCSPNSFYVHRLCNLGEIEKIKVYFSKNANRSKRAPSQVEYGQMYLAQFSHDHHWYRVRVIRVDGAYCDLFYVDWGNTEKRVLKTKLRDIPDKYAEIPDQALHCGLFNCTPIAGQWGSGANDLITRMALNKELSMYVENINHASGFHEVHLRCANEKNGGSITDSLIYNGFATRIESTDNSQGLFKNSAFGARKNAFKNTIIKEHEVFDGQVTHINSPSNFYIQKITEGGSDLMLKLMSELSETYSRYETNEGLVFTPSAGMPVAARFQNDGSWYRAMVLNIPEPRKVQVKYVDFGFVAIVGIEDVRELQDKFLRVGAQALNCSLNDIAPKHPRGWPASAKTVFEKLVMDKGLLRVQVEKVKDDFSLSIVLYETLPTKYINISGVLVKKGHALSTGQTSAQAEYACQSESEVNNLPVEQPKSDSGSIYSEFSETSKVSGKGSQRQRGARAAKRVEKPSLLDRTKRDFEEEVHPDHQDSQEVDENFDNRVKVQILKIMSPSEIHVAVGNIPKLINKLIKEMTAFYTSAQEVEERDWSVKDLCAVLKSDDGKWYRGIITSTSHTNYKVFIKDIVDVVDVDRSMLRTLDDRFFTVSDGSIKVHLSGLRVPAGLKTWPSSTTDYLRRLVEESESLYIHKLGDLVSDSLPVRLWRRTQRQQGPLDPLKDEWCDVNHSLIELGFALPHQATDETTPGTPEPNDKYVRCWLDNSFQPIHEIQPKENTVEEVVAEAPYVSYASELEKDETLSVKSVRSTRGKPRSRSNRGRFPSQRACYIPTMLGPEGPELVTEWKPAVPFKKLNFIGQPTYVDYECNIYIQDVDGCASTLELLEKAFLSLFENSEKRPYEEQFLEGQICVAFFEPNRKWYRGRVLKVKPEHIEVLFVDYGNVEELQPEELRKQVTMGHIPIQCHKCRTEGIIPISPDKKWPVRALDFIHGAVVDQRCELSLKPPSPGCDDYVILSLKLPGGEDLLETLLSMHYATYVIDLEAGAGEDDEEIIEDQEIQAAFSNNLASKALAEEIQNMCSNLEKIKTQSIQGLPPATSEEVLIVDVVNSLKRSEGVKDWYEIVENDVEDDVEPPVSPGFISELDTTPRMDLKYRDMILPDSIVEFSVDVLTVCSFNSVKVMIRECDDPEIMGYVNEFDKLQQLMQEEAESLPNLTYPVKDLVCLGCYSDDDSWYRAIVVDVLPDKNLVSVLYVDYANVEDVPITRLKEINPDWILTPVQAIQVTLNNVREGPNYEGAALCQAAYSSCLMSPPYIMAIESRFPVLTVELYTSEGEIAYKPLLDAGVVIKEELL